MSGTPGNLDDLCHLAEQCWSQEKPHEALQAAWAALDLRSCERTRRLVARLLEYYAGALQSERRESYLTLLADPEVEPDTVSTAGWILLLRSHRLAEDTDVAHKSLVTALEGDKLALTLLRESPVYFVAAEQLLTGLRRWLLLSGQWRNHPELVAALKIQTSLNGGAWPFDKAERAQLAQLASEPIKLAYLPERLKRNAPPPNATDGVTRAVAEQYEGWPYPMWTRITVGEPVRLPDAIRSKDPSLADALPVKAHILVAGCGTGRQAAYVAQRYPDATITAIDISEASLDYAKRQCGALGIENIRFLQLDLHDVAGLDRRFHSIHCGGVLHHLPSPERGFALLSEVLHESGVMQVMVYNRTQRLVIAAAQTLLGDLTRRPITDDLLRDVRSVILQNADHSAANHIIKIRDFATLAGACDLLLHRHEDPFDVTRIERALNGAGLRIVSFDMLPPVAARYDAMFPEDPKHQNSNSWARFVRVDPTAMLNHFTFWCCKSLQISP